MSDPYNNIDNPYGTGGNTSGGTDRNPYGGGNNPYGTNGNTPYNYGPPSYPHSGGERLATAAMILGILSVVTGVMLQFYFSMVAGSIGIVLALLSKGRAPKLASRARTGLITSAVGLVFTCLICGAAFGALYTNPQLMEQVNEIFTQQYGLSYEEMMDAIINGEEILLHNPVQ